MEIESTPLVVQEKNINSDTVMIVDKHDDKKKGLTFWLSCSIFAAAAGSSLQFGYNTSVVNAPEDVLKEFMNSTNYKERGSYLSSSKITLLWALVVAIFCVGGMVGGVSAGYFANKFGRKGSLLLNNILAVVGVALLVFSKTANSWEMLIAGRFVLGVNNGINSGVAPLYMSEIAPMNLRGASGTIHQLAICIGIVIALILGLEPVLGTKDMFPYLFGFSIIPVILQLIIFPMCPESPKYLYITKKDKVKTENALIKLRGTLDVEEELIELHNEASIAWNERKVTVSDMFSNAHLRSPLIICIVIQLSQQLSGINAVFYYSTSIFKDALGEDSKMPQYATLGIGAVNALMTIVSAVLVEKAGRRTLLLAGFGGMWVFSIILTTSFAWKSAGWTWASYISIPCIVCYVIAFAIGPGSIPWFIVAELFAQGPRTVAISISVMVNWLANGTVGLGYPELQSALKEYNFVPFSVLLTIFWLFIYFKLPETKGKSVEQMTSMFKSGYKLMEHDSDHDD